MKAIKLSLISIIVAVSLMFSAGFVVAATVTYNVESLSRAITLSDDHPGAEGQLWVEVKNTSTQNVLAEYALHYFGSGGLNVNDDVEVLFSYDSRKMVISQHLLWPFNGSPTVYTYLINVEDGSYVEIMAANAWKGTFLNSAKTKLIIVNHGLIGPGGYPSSIYLYLLENGQQLTQHEIPGFVDAYANPVDPDFPYGWDDILKVTSSSGHYTGYPQAFSHYYKVNEDNTINMIFYDYNTYLAATLDLEEKEGISAYLTAFVSIDYADTGYDVTLIHENDPNQIYILSYSRLQTLLKITLPDGTIHEYGILRVPAQYPTIQEALSAASFGNIVLVAPGVYGVYEDDRYIAIPGGVILRGENRDTTVIDTDGEIYLLSNSALENFTINSTTLENWVFDAVRENTCENIVIKNNRINVTGPTQLRGIGILGGRNIDIKNNVIVLDSTSAPDTVGSPVFGVDVYVLTAPLPLNFPSDIHIVNNTIHAKSNTRGHAIRMDTSQGNIIKNNSVIVEAPTGNAISAASQMTVDYNAFFSGIEPVSSTTTLGEGNLFNLLKEDEFADEAYHLALGSELIDAGDPNDNYSNEPMPNGSRINIGAYGNTEEATITDIIKPVITNITPLNGSYTINKRPSFHANVSDNGRLKHAYLYLDPANTISNTRTLVYDVALSSSEAVIDYTPSSDRANGKYVYYLVAKDTSDNSSNISTTFTVDTISPVIKSIYPKSGSSTTSPYGLPFKADLTDTYGLSRAYLYLDNALVMKWSLNGVTQKSISWGPSSKILSIGRHRYDIIVYDLAGNRVSKYIMFYRY